MPSRTPDVDPEHECETPAELAVWHALEGAIDAQFGAGYWRRVGIVERREALTGVTERGGTTGEVVERWAAWEESRKRQGRPPLDPDRPRYQSRMVGLTADQWAAVREIGDRNASAGVRRLLAYWQEHQPDRG